MVKHMSLFLGIGKINKYLYLFMVSAILSIYFLRKK